MNFNEKPPQKQEDNEKELKHQEKLRIYKELVESGEVFDFKGLDPEWYEKMKKADEEDEWGFTTPTDELIQRAQEYGFRFIQGNGPESGNVFIIPNDSSDIVKDSILVDRLDINKVEDPRIARLIELCR